MPFELFVNGGLMRGLPAHHNMGDSVFLRESRTAPRYRMHSIANNFHPGMYEAGEGGFSFPGEIYLVHDHHWPALAAVERSLNLYRGIVTLENGERMYGILYPRELVERHQWPEISRYGGWRNYLATLPAGAPA